MMKTPLSITPLQANKMQKLVTGLAIAIMLMLPPFQIPGADRRFGTGHAQEASALRPISTKICFEGLGFSPNGMPFRFFDDQAPLILMLNNLDFNNTASKSLSEDIIIYGPLNGSISIELLHALLSAAEPRKSDSEEQLRTKALYFKAANEIAGLDTNLLVYKGYPVAFAFWSKAGHLYCISLAPALSSNIFEEGAEIPMQLYEEFTTALRRLGYKSTHMFLTAWVRIAKLGIRYLPVFPGIFRPGDGYDIALAEAALKDLYDGDKALDLGCGSGVISVALSMNKDIIVHAVDNKMFAIPNTEASALLHGTRNKVQAWLSDGLSNVNERYNAVLLNAPIVKSSREARTWYFDTNKYDIDGRFMDSVLSQIRRVLLPGCSLYLMVIPQATFQLVHDLFDRYNLKKELVSIARAKSGIIFYIYKITPQEAPTAVSNSVSTAVRIAQSA